MGLRRSELKKNALNSTIHHFEIDHNRSTPGHIYKGLETKIGWVLNPTICVGQEIKMKDARCSHTKTNQLA